MPWPSIIGIHAAIVWLVAGASLGGLILGGSSLIPPGALGWLVAIHIEAMLFGWMLQVTLLTAWWLLPRRPERRGEWWAGDDGRGPFAIGIPATIGVNVAVLTRAIGHAISSHALVFFGGFLLAGSMIAFFIVFRTRVRSFDKGAVNVR